MIHQNPADKKKTTAAAAKTVVKDIEPMPAKTKTEGSTIIFDKDRFYLVSISVFSLLTLMHPAEGVTALLGTLLYLNWGKASELASKAKGFDYRSTLSKIKKGIYEKTA